MTRMLMGAGPGAWRRPLLLAGLCELAALGYFHVTAMTPHTVSLFSWLPFGRWGAGGPVSVALLYTVCLTMMFVAWGLLLRDLSLRPGGPADTAVVFGGAAAFSLTFLFTPALLSKDLFDYMGHGRVMSQYGANPFTTPATTFVTDPFTLAMGWPDSTPLYGPAWASVCALLTLLGANSFVGTALLFKVFFAVVHLVNGLLILRIARGWGGRPGLSALPLRAAAFYLWNPLALTQTVADAHNDAFALMWLLACIRLLQRREDLTAAACGALSVLVKYVTAPVLLLLLIQRWKERGLVKAGLMALACAAAACLAYLPYLSGFSPTHFLRPYEHASYQGGLMMAIDMAAGAVLGGGDAPGAPVPRLMLVMTLVVLALLAGWYVRAALRAATLHQAVDAGTWFLLVYLLFATALLRTSYLVWIVGLAALAATVRLRRCVAVFSASVLSLEVFWIYRLLQPAGTPLNGPKFLATVVAVGVPILYLLLHFRGWPGQGVSGGEPMEPTA